MFLSISWVVVPLPTGLGDSVLSEQRDGGRSSHSAPATSLLPFRQTSGRKYNAGRAIAATHSPAGGKQLGGGQQHLPRASWARRRGEGCGRGRGGARGPSHTHRTSGPALPRPPHCACARRRGAGWEVALDWCPVRRPGAWRTGELLVALLQR